eukprot:TRINITY_DN6599_c0_g1_i1.p1 TRINITY_DN6599_c0_g1~~TRINITY_DN6599_c0_g1_i1.p1  ORF type:complete len:342 (+),score=90.76 TRINITY_DN6599_c0_g1_i1:55-1026(+)
MFVSLASGTKMPVVGFGTWKIPKETTAAAVEQALRAGYRNIDCACDYGNEVEVGIGLKNAFEAGVCKREDVFVTSKLWNTYHSKEHVKLACQRTLKDLGLDYLDLYLIHFPISLKFIPFEVLYPPEWVDVTEEPKKMRVVDVPISETWAEMENLVTEGLVRHIGVANFNFQLLTDLQKYAKIKPAVNQIEIHPFLTQERMLRWCKMTNVVVTAYSSFGGASYVELGMATSSDSALENPVIKEIAAKHSKTPAQVILRWCAQLGITVVVKSSNEDRLKQNLAVDTFQLSDDDMKAIGSLNVNRRFNDPGVFCEAAFGQFYPIYN